MHKIGYNMCVYNIDSFEIEQNIENLFTKQKILAVGISTSIFVSLPKNTMKSFFKYFLSWSKKTQCKSFKQNISKENLSKKDEIMLLAHNFNL